MKACSTTVTPDTQSSGDRSGDQWIFKLKGGGDGVLHVSDPLLSTEALSQERAESEFLKNGYTKRTCSFSTYRTDLLINDEIKVRGLNWLVKHIRTTITKSSVVATVTAVRYE